MSEAIDELRAKTYWTNNGWIVPLADVERIIEKLEGRLAYLDNAPQLGLATTAQLIDELRARCEINGTLSYRTVDGDQQEEQQC